MKLRPATSCAVGSRGVENGTVYCWGADYYGQASPPSGNFSAVSAGYHHSCGIRDDGSIECWGDGYWLQTYAPSLQNACPAFSQ